MFCYLVINDVDYKILYQVLSKFGSFYLFDFNFNWKIRNIMMKYKIIKFFNGLNAIEKRGEIILVAEKMKNKIRKIS